jgi:putative ABC transport system permease protein
VIGRSLTLDRVSFTIVGVTPPGFYGPEPGWAHDVIVPIGTEPLLRGGDSALDRRSTWWLEVMVRLKAAQDFASATRALRGVQPQIREATMPPDEAARFMAEYLREPFTLVPAGTGTSYLRLRYERPLVTIMIVVGLVLLIACANIANLLLARAAARQHEFGVRLALGASQWRLARLLLTESLLISGTGALCGLLFAQWAAPLLMTQLSTPRMRVFVDLSLDWRVLGFTTAAGIATTLLFGLVPAARAARVQPSQALNLQSRGIVGATAARAGSALVIVQVALSLMLVVAGGLFLRTFDGLAHVNLGFDRDPVLVVNITAPQDTVPPENRIAEYERVRQAAERVPGVANAALSVVTPVSNSTWQFGVEVSGAMPRSQREKAVFANFIGPGWFAAYGTRLVAGRDFSPRDGRGAARVAIVNQAFAKHFLNAASPLGHTVRHMSERPGHEKPMEIIGVAADAVYRSLRDPAPPTLYLPFAQIDEPPSGVRLSVRSAGRNPALLVREVTNAVARVDSHFALTFYPLKAYVDGALVQERMVAMLSGFFGGLALLLAGLGLYGVTAHMVGRRRAEIGIRMALGSTPGSVVRRVLARVAVLVAAGVVLGAVASAWAVRFVSTLLFDVEARDPWTFAGSALLLIAVACAAAWLPARRAARIDPATVLRAT